MFFGYLALATSIVLTCIAGYFSVHGMIALFAANAIGVAVMMTCLEAAKVVTAGWLKMNWTSRTVPLLHKAYLTVATVILMVLTSIGIYGYLSAGHLEQQAPIAGIELQTSGLERQIAVKDAEVKRIEARLAQIDKNIDTFLNSDKATAGLRASNSLKGERDKLQKTLDERNGEINALNEKLTPLKQQGSEVEAKLGPIKYVAALFGMTDPESAVRIVIMMIMAVFDPLAIVLMISGLISISQRKAIALPASEPEGEKEIAPEPDLPAVSAAPTIDDEDLWPALTEEDLEKIHRQWIEINADPITEEAIIEPEAEEAVAEVPVDAVEQSKIVVVNDGQSRVVYAAQSAPEDDSSEVIEDEAPIVPEAPIDEVVEPETTNAAEQFEIVEDEVLPALADDNEIEGNLLLELERDREEGVVDEKEHREKLIRLLEENEDFLKEVASVISDIERERILSQNAGINGGAAVVPTITHHGADPQ